jgi:hypothetical protein
MKPDRAAVTDHAPLDRSSIASLASAALAQE